MSRHDDKKGVTMKADRVIVAFAVLVYTLAPGSGLLAFEGQVSRDASDASGLIAMPMMNPPVAAILPSSRSVQVGRPATAFATMINMGSGMATGCGMAPPANMPGTFMYQTTNPATNQTTGMPNTPTDMPMGGSQTFMFAFTPTGPMDSTDMAMSFRCTNTDPAAVQSGVNTMLVSASPAPVTDMVALAATLDNDGIVNVPGSNGTGAFAVATVNMGLGATVTASADTGGAGMPVTLFMCQTNPGTGQCISPIGLTVTAPVDAGATPTFAIFVAGGGMVPFDPAANRVFVRFRDAGGVTRGMTSVAVRTQ
jgi:hypothetical protein